MLLLHATSCGAHVRMHARALARSRTGFTDTLPERLARIFSVMVMARLTWRARGAWGANVWGGGGGTRGSMRWGGRARRVQRAGGRAAACSVVRHMRGAQGGAGRAGCWLRACVRGPMRRGGTAAARAAARTAACCQRPTRRAACCCVSWRAAAAAGVLERRGRGPGGGGASALTEPVLAGDLACCGGAWMADTRTATPLRPLLPWHELRECMARRLLMAAACSALLGLRGWWGGAPGAVVCAPISNGCCVAAHALRWRGGAHAGQRLQPAPRTSATHALTALWT